ncbi:MAG: hypothetical protein DRJ40_02680 [Thermoprotei archaeon]|nr:MAG: hypothetical protein DRJ40_02680 [Thermoprotei archaeon]
MFEKSVTINGFKSIREGKLDEFTEINIFVCRNNTEEVYCTRSSNPQITAGILHPHKSINPEEAKLVLSLESRHRRRGANP